MIDKYFTAAAAPILPWVLAGVVAVFGVMGVVIAYQRIEHRADVASLALKDEQLADATDANATNQTTIADLTAANDELILQRAADKAASDKAIAEQRARADTLKAALAVSQSKLAEIYASDLSAAAWGRSVVPASVADWLRQ